MILKLLREQIIASPEYFTDDLREKVFEKALNSITHKLETE